MSAPTARSVLSSWVYSTSPSALTTSSTTYGSEYTPSLAIVA